MVVEEALYQLPHPQDAVDRLPTGDECVILFEGCLLAYGLSRKANGPPT